MAKKSKRKNNQKEEKIMENTNVEELNQNIEEVVTETNEEVTEPTEQIEETTEEVEESNEQNEETTEEVEESNEEVESPSIEDTEDQEVIGTLIDCKLLYVRQEPNRDSQPLGTVSAEDTISVDLNNSTDEFYKVFTSNGLEGYCVKQFVKID